MSCAPCPRVVEIYSTGSGLYGSGFLLGGGLVLTARHVLTETARDVSVRPTTIKVRTLEMTRRRQDALIAELVWPATLQKVADHQPDIALIRIPTNALDLKKAPTLRLLGMATGADQGMNSLTQVSAVGFPVFRDMGEDGRDTKQLTGMVEAGDNLVSNQLVIQQADLPVLHEDAERSARLDWSGMSGAAVFTVGNDRSDSVPELVGVLVASLRVPPYNFKAVRIDALLDDETARSRMLGAITRVDSAEGDIFGNGGVKPPPAVLEPFAIHKLVCLLDRSAQESSLVSHYRKATSLREQSMEKLVVAKPLILVLPGAGRPEHAPEELIERLRVRTLSQRIRWPGSSAATPMLPWASSSGSPDDAVEEMRESLWNAMGENTYAPDDPESFVRLWRDGTRPRLFWSSDLPKYKLTASSVTVLAAWAQFWTALVPEDRLVPIHLLPVDADQKGAQDWIDRAEAIVNTGAIHALPELCSCSNLDLITWLMDLPQDVPVVHHRFVSIVDQTLREEYWNDFFLRDLRNRVQKLVGENCHD